MMSIWDCRYRIIKGGNPVYGGAHLLLANGMKDAYDKITEHLNGDLLRPPNESGYMYEISGILEFPESRNLR